MSTANSSSSGSGSRSSCGTAVDVNVINDGIDEKNNPMNSIKNHIEDLKRLNKVTEPHNFLPSDEERFLIELEFIQNLSNPKYLSYLAQNKYFQDESFMAFLKYLRYFKEPQYLRHLIFPVCLTFLDELIGNVRFRQELLSPAFIDYIHAQQGRKVCHSHSNKCIFSVLFCSTFIESYCLTIFPYTMDSLFTFLFSFAPGLFWQRRFCKNDDITTTT